MDTDSQWALKMEGMARGRVCREPIFLAEPSFPAGKIFLV
jgi:hypothetical protein